MKVIYILLLLIIASCSHINSFQDDYTLIIPSNLDIKEHPDSNVFQDFLEEHTLKGFPGSMMLIQSNEGLWIGSSGKADIKNGVIMHPFHLTRIGSISKLFFSTAIMTLVDSGQLNLDDKISKYVPVDVISKIHYADSATIRQILNHTSGITNDLSDTDFALNSLFDNPLESYTYSDYIAAFYNKESPYKPGEWNYSNIGYNLLGYIIESVTGKSHWQVLQDNILRPLHLNNTYYSPHEAFPKGLARGYFDMYGDNTIYDVSEYKSFILSPAGSVISNPYDLMIFITKLFNGSIISRQSLNEMLRTVPVPKEKGGSYFNTEYGLGIYCWDTPYGVAFGHSGQVWGYRSELHFFPESETTVVILINGTFGNIDKKLNEMIDEIPDLLLSQKAIQ